MLPMRRKFIAVDLVWEPVADLHCLNAEDDVLKPFFWAAELERHRNGPHERQTVPPPASEIPLESAVGQDFPSRTIWIAKSSSTAM